MTEEQIRKLRQLINAYVDARVRLSHCGRQVDKEVRKAELNVAERKEALDVFIDSIRG